MSSFTRYEKVSRPRRDWDDDDDDDNDLSNDEEAKTQPVPRQPPAGGWHRFSHNGDDDDDDIDDGEGDYDNDDDDASESNGRKRPPVASTTKAQGEPTLGDLFKARSTTNRRVIPSLTVEQLLATEGLPSLPHQISRRVSDRAWERTCLRSGPAAAGTSATTAISTTTTANHAAARAAAANYSRSLRQAYADMARIWCPLLTSSDVLSQVEQLGTKKPVKELLQHMRDTVRNEHLESIFGKETAQRLVAELEFGLQQQQQQPQQSKESQLDHTQDKPDISPHTPAKGVILKRHDDGEDYEEEYEADFSATTAVRSTPSANAVVTPTTGNTARLPFNPYSMRGNDKDTAMEQPPRRKRLHDDRASEQLDGEQHEAAADAAAAAEMTESRPKTSPIHPNSNRTTERNTSVDPSSTFYNNITTTNGSKEDENDDDDNDDGHDILVASKRQKSRRGVIEDDDDDDNNDYDCHEDHDPIQQDNIIDNDNSSPRHLAPSDEEMRAGTAASRPISGDNARNNTIIDSSLSLEKSVTNHTTDTITFMDNFHTEVPTQIPTQTTAMDTEEWDLGQENGMVSEVPTQIVTMMEDHSVVPTQVMEEGAMVTIDPTQSWTVMSSTTARSQTDEPQRDPGEHGLDEDYHDNNDDDVMEEDAPTVLPTQTMLCEVATQIMTQSASTGSQETIKGVNNNDDDDDNNDDIEEEDGRVHDN